MLCSSLTSVFGGLILISSSLPLFFQAYLSLRRERDLTIQSLFTKHNLGLLPSIPFTNEVAFNLTNRIKSRLLDLEKDLQDKKVGTICLAIAFLSLFLTIIALNVYKVFVLISLELFCPEDPRCASKISCTSK